MHIIKLYDLGSRICLSICLRTIQSLLCVRLIFPILHCPYTNRLLCFLLRKPLPSRARPRAAQYLTEVRYISLFRLSWQIYVLNSNAVWYSRCCLITVLVLRYDHPRCKSGFIPECTVTWIIFRWNVQLVCHRSHPKQSVYVQNTETL